MLDSISAKSSVAVARSTTAALGSQPSRNMTMLFAPSKMVSSTKIKLVGDDSVKREPHPLDWNLSKSGLIHYGTEYSTPWSHAGLCFLCYFRKVGRGECHLYCKSVAVFGMNLLDKYVQILGRTKEEIEYLVALLLCSVHHASRCRRFFF